MGKAAVSSARAGRAEKVEKPVKPAKAPKPPKIAFPKKNQPPSVAQFAALLPLPVGKRFEGVRSFLTKQKEVTEDVYFYGPKSGWGLRYLQGGRPVCTLFVHGDRPLGIVSLDPAANEGVDWRSLSDVGQKARRAAHGSPTMLWVDVALDASGATDFKAILKAKLEALRASSA
jgi:hypothetical protein